MSSTFQLLLCSCNPRLIGAAVAAGVDCVVVEWENIDNRDGSISGLDNFEQKKEDLRRVRHCTDAWVICRLSSYREETAEEVKQAIDLGADEILLPGVQTVEEVETAFRLANDRCAVGIVLETLEAMRLTSTLAQFPLSRVHIGLNDLAHTLNYPHSFWAIADGTVERILQDFTVPSGFGGLTLPKKGFPIPCRLLMGELVRLGCTFSLLRRSFIADTLGRNLILEVSRINEELAKLAKRTSQEIEQDRKALYRIIKDFSRTKEEN